MLIDEIEVIDDAHCVMLHDENDEMQQIDETFTYYINEILLLEVLHLADEYDDVDDKELHVDEITDVIEPHEIGGMQNLSNNKKDSIKESFYFFIFMFLFYIKVFLN